MGDVRCHHQYQLSEVHHYNDESGTTTNWYDGDDRLVEVELPHDTNDQYSYSWLTRNIYDLSQSSGVTIGGTSGLYAHGNLFKTQEYVGVTSDTPAWNDVKGDTYDAMDREASHYAYEPGTSTLEHSTNAYDQTTATAALLTTATDALGEVKTPTYNAAGSVTETAYSDDGGVTPSETLTVDPDARPATVTSSSMGEMTTSYDKDGKVTEVEEPSGGSVTSPADYTYTYYTDGQRAGLSVSSTELTQSNMLQYAYRTDGLRAKLAFADGAVSASWAWTQSDAGRTTAIADSSGQTTRTITYDAYGRTATDTMPAGEMSSFTYDDEGEVTGYSFPEMDGSTSTTLAYTARGEFASETFADGSSCPDGSDSTLVTVSNHYANGVPIPDNTCGYSTLTWDKHAGSITATGSSSNYTDSLYDAAGRQTTAENPWSVSWTCGDGECGGSDTGERTRSYDTENHLIGDTYSGWSTSGLSGCVADKTDTPHDQIDGLSGTMAYNWGPNGHPDRWVGGIGFSALTLHWDGDTPLFITDNSGTLQEIKIEGLGFYAPSATNPMTFIDRDQSGFVVAAHWNGGTGPWTASNPFHQTCDGEGISGYALFEPGPDGITDTVNMMQGVRSYDPALGTWTSPDAYAGDASDPMSRKSFMWNRNNAYAYADPTGFASDPVVAKTLEQFSSDLNKSKNQLAYGYFNQTTSQLTLYFGSGGQPAEQVTVNVGESSVRPFSAKDISPGDYTLGDPTWSATGVYKDDGSQVEPGVGTASIPLRSASGANDIVANDGSHHDNVMFHGGGSALGAKAFDPDQKLMPTLGCVRMHNADATALANAVLHDGGTMDLGIVAK
jgi:YD repeat-containing protein